MIDSIKEVTGVDFNTVETDEEAQKIAKDLNMEIDPIKTTRGDIIVQVFEEKVEEKCKYPLTLAQAGLYCFHDEDFLRCYRVRQGSTLNQSRLGSTSHREALGTSNG